MSQNLRTKCVILRRTNYGEADRILTILTSDSGQLSVMARGVRKEKSRLAGGIELFAICDVSLVRSTNNTGDMWTLTGAKLNKFFAQIMQNYDKLQFGYEAIKQITKASQTLNEPEFYELLVDVLTALDDQKIALKVIETWFYLQLAKLLGNELNVLTDNNGMKLVEDARYNFDTTEQVFMFDANGRFDARAIKLLRVMLTNPLGVVGKIANTDDIIDDCLHLAKIAAKI
ncbi:DNA repair protein RecO [Candidatus Saccharibacteria bacterium]|nr:DNA repair protein RecO [Candidatus Saccharibacteria bacterium]MCL1962769.1 DNA repair protein RecO [Candidatus Saccharibacteria bacterium]